RIQGSAAGPGDGARSRPGRRGAEDPRCPGGGAEEGLTSRYPSIAPDILALFAARGTNAVDVPVLQPADPFLDMAGEDLRRRIFLTESETGASLCLRPEFTIPVCLDHI